MTRHRKRLVVAVVALPAVAYLAWVGYVRLCCDPVQLDIMVGRTEGQIRVSYGPPDKDWQGYQSLALYTPPSLPPGPIRTLIFHPHGVFHPEAGTLWVLSTERAGEWVCFESCWFADGVKF